MNAQLLPELPAPRRRRAGAVPDARKNRLTGPKARQETVERAPYHSSGAGLVGAVAPRARGEAPAPGFDTSKTNDREEKESGA
jgi:hypothetical protein